MTTKVRFLSSSRMLCGSFIFVAFFVLFVAPPLGRAQDAPDSEAAGAKADSAAMADEAKPTSESPAPAAKESDEDDYEEIVVTGTPTKVNKFETSYAISSFDEIQIETSAPLGTADLLVQVPGMWAESSGGEAGNNVFARGIPQDGSYRYVALYEDGLPLFEEGETSFLNVDVLSRMDLSIARVEVVRGGSSPIFASNAPGGTINLITKKGTPTFEGVAKLTWGDYDLYRFDTHIAGPVTDNLTFSLGGFYRIDNGLRSPGFIGNQGGQVRGSLNYGLDNGEIRVYGKYLNDRTIFHLPIPLADPRDPSVSLAGLIDPNTGTMASNDVRLVSYRKLDGNGGSTVVQKDLAEGIHPQVLTVGASFDYEFLLDWTIRNHARYVQGGITFNGLFSTHEPQDADTLLAKNFAAANNAFPDMDRLEYRFANSGGRYDPAEANGLVIRSGWWAIQMYIENFVDDLRVSGVIDAGVLGQHTVTAGTYFSAYSLDTTWDFNTVLMELRNRPRRLNIVAVDANGDQVGSVTENGFVSYGDFGVDASVDAFSWALYAYDEWQLWDDLRIDFGVRYQSTESTGSAANRTSQNLNDDSTLADDNVGGPDGTYQRKRDLKSGTAVSAGANYTILDGLGVLGRFTRAFRIPDLENTYTMGNRETEGILQAEVGVKVETAPVSLFAVGFWSHFDSVAATDSVIDPDTNTTTTLNLTGETMTLGLETEVQLRPGKLLSILDGLNIGLVTTLQDPRYKNVLDENTGLEYAEFVNKRVRRLPVFMFGVRPSYKLALFDRLSFVAYAAYQYSGDHPVDYHNNTILPDYNTLDAGFIATLDTLYSLQFHVANIFNSSGLTEGNPRTGALTGQGSLTPIYGRPILGRNFRISLTANW